MNSKRCGLKEQECNRKNKGCISTLIKKLQLSNRQDLISQLIYATKGSDVEEPLMIENEFLALNHKDIIEKIEIYAKDLTS